MAIVVSQTTLFLFPNKTNAVVPVIDLPNLAANTTTATGISALVAKEYVADPLWVVAAKIAIDMLTTSTVNWINSGFQGGPAYVTDLKGFLLDLADAETAIFIEELGLTDLCSPWKLDIRIALSLPTGQFSRKVECTLSDIVANMDDFINGDFSQGGWAGWFELTTKPQNNPYGLYLMTASELDQRIAGTQQEQTQLLSFGSGFLSQTDCEEGPQPKGGGPGAPINCKITTPGSIIEDQLAHVLGSGVRQLELADEFNEIVSALLGQLLQQAMGGFGGLRGASRSFNGQPSLTSQISNSQNEELLTDIKDFAIVGIDNDIGNETDYRNIKQSTLNSVLASENLLLSLQVCYAGKLTDSSLNLTQSEEALAQTRMNNASTTITTQITLTKTSLESDIVLSDQNITNLNKFKTDILSTRTSEEINILVNELTLLRLSGKIGSSDIYIAQQQQSVIVAQMSALNTTTNTQIAECQVFPPPQPIVIP